jgi:hypothetical protein
MTVVRRFNHSQEAGRQAGPSRTGRHTRGEWRLPSLCDDGDRAPAGRGLRLPPLPAGATFGQHYDIVLVVDSREQVPDIARRGRANIRLACAVRPQSSWPGVNLDPDAATYSEPSLLRFQAHALPFAKTSIQSQCVF